MSSWLQLAQEAIKIPGLLVEIYGDLAKPGVKQAGKALETIVGLGNTLLWPIALLNDKSSYNLKKNLEKYRAEMESVAEEKVIGISPEIGVPIAEKITYIGDANLAELYIKLLATASNADTVAFAHPGYVNVINSICPDEAKLIGYMAATPQLPIVIATAKGSTGYKPIAGPFTSDAFLATLDFKQNLDTYLSNLSGLGLLTVSFTETLTDANQYNSIENREKLVMEPILKSLPQFKDRQLDFRRGVIQRTSFGMNFAHACKVKSADRS